MPRVVHFEINADEPERASKFYTAIFGWEIKNWGGPVPYWLITTGPDNVPGINGGIMNRWENQATINTVGVPNIEEYVEKVKAAGGSVVDEKKAIPGMGYHIYCRDTEGNMFGLFQDDTNAK